MNKQQVQEIFENQTDPNIIIYGQAPFKIVTIQIQLKV